ncbi:hypothetical protein EDB84DRAFT_1435312 [Lactarius hengduanensis]|nr:hypothetical protein EDB84DRAFT_1435312 [Lactarius hengduanensis]
MYDESGNFSQHVQQFKGDPVFQLWMTKIGPYLADWVLDKRDDPTALRLPWRLLDFPQGYTLWVHLTGDQSDPANPRTDAYLHGSAHKIFRSPMEFVEHAIWLMKSGSVGDQCLCKYCTPGQNQRAINRRLDRRDESDGPASPATTAAAATVAPPWPPPPISGRRATNSSGIALARASSPRLRRVKHAPG